MSDYDEVIEAFAANAVAILYNIEAAGGCMSCLDTGTWWREAREVPCRLCSHASELARHARETERQRAWTRSDLDLLADLRKVPDWQIV
jgi:hypothetical protein